KLVIPPDLMAGPNAKREGEPVPPSQLVAHLRKTSVHLLETVASDISATETRKRAHRGQSIHGLVSARVEAYILKQGLYSEDARDIRLQVKADTLPKAVRLAVEAAQNKKASAITVLDLSSLGTFTEFFVICTGFSTPQVQAICSEVEEILYKELK